MEQKNYTHRAILRKKEASTTYSFTVTSFDTRHFMKLKEVARLDDSVV